ncbi:MAG: DUF5333 domain-containing protein [Pseudomonadota bacterium]
MAITLTLCAAPLSLQADLNDEPRIQSGMIALGMGNMIRENCPSISARMVRAYWYLKSLESHALDLGYSKVQIESYTDNDQEKARLLGLARARLQDKGVNFDDPQTFCTVGQAEIAANSAIGRLLRAN